MNRKVIFTFFLFIFFLSACKQEKKVAVRENEAEIEFEVTYHDFGKFPKNEIREYNFVFYNVGATPLVIQDVIPTCGCIKERHPEEPIMPGCSGTITAIYNEPSISPSHFHKAIGVHSNAKTAYVQLIVDGETTSADTEGNDVDTEHSQGSFRSVPDSLFLGEWHQGDKAIMVLNPDGTISMKKISDIVYLSWNRVSANILLISRQGRYGGLVTDTAEINTFISPMTMELKRVNDMFTKQ